MLVECDVNLMRVSNTIVCLPLFKFAPALVLHGHKFHNISKLKISSISLLSASAITESCEQFSFARNDGRDIKLVEKIDFNEW